MLPYIVPGKYYIPISNILGRDWLGNSIFLCLILEEFILECKESPNAKEDINLVVQSSISHIKKEQTS